MEPVKRKAGRPPAQKPAEQLGPSLKLTVETDRILTISAKKLKLSKREYANAAVAFFAESGLDPTVERPEGLSGVSSNVTKTTLAVREQNVDIANRLISIIRGWENNLYIFMQQQQVTMNTYLEAIESNLLKQQVSTETNLLVPMIEQVFKASLEGYAGRIVGERSYLKITQKPPTDWTGQHAALNGERDQLLEAALREFKKDHPITLPQVTPRPAVTQVPPKPVATSPAPAAKPVLPKS